MISSKIHTRLIGRTVELFVFFPFVLFVAGSMCFQCRSFEAIHVWTFRAVSFEIVLLHTLDRIAVFVFVFIEKSTFWMQWSSRNNQLYIYKYTYTLYSFESVWFFLIIYTLFYDNTNVQSIGAMKNVYFCLSSFPIALKFLSTFWL